MLKTFLPQIFIADSNFSIAVVSINYVVVKEVKEVEEVREEVKEVFILKNLIEL